MNNHSCAMRSFTDPEHIHIHYYIPVSYSIEFTPSANGWGLQYFEISIVHMGAIWCHITLNTDIMPPENGDQGQLSRRTILVILVLPMPLKQESTILAPLPGLAC